MRSAFLCVFMAALAGCAQLDAAMRQAHENRMAAIESTCARYGLTKGTPEFGQCMMQVDQAQRNAEAARQAQYQQRQNDIYKSQMQMFNRPQPRPGISCTSNTTFGTTYTNCN